MSGFSTRTLGQFEDACSGYLVLRDIDRVFGDSGITQGVSSKEGGGQRRTLFRDYVAGVDQRDASDLKRLAEALSWILEMLERNEYAKDTVEALRRSVSRDGFTYENGQLRGNRSAASPNFTAVTIEDLQHIGDHAVELHRLALEQPAQAIGGGKELVESVCKTLLRLAGETVSKDADLVALAKATMKTLELVPSDVDDAKKGADMVRRCLQQLGAVVASLGELRNTYGSGHGRDGKWKGLGPRHARLAIGAAITVADFFAETYLERNPPEKRV